MTESSEITLETALRRLDQIVTALEREDMDLDHALALFEEGVNRLRAAQRMLADAELKVQRLIADRSGPVLEDMDIEPGD